MLLFFLLPFLSSPSKDIIAANTCLLVNINGVFSNEEKKIKQITLSKKVTFSLVDELR